MPTVCRPGQEVTVERAAPVNGVSTPFVLVAVNVVPHQFARREHVGGHLINLILNSFEVSVTLVATRCIPPLSIKAAVRRILDDGEGGSEPGSVPGKKKQPSA